MRRAPKPRTSRQEFSRIFSASALSLYSARSLDPTGSRGGQLIATVVIAVIGVPLSPGPLDLMLRHQSVQFVPQVLIDHWFLRRGLPPIAFPAVNPFGD